MAFEKHGTTLAMQTSCRPGIRIQACMEASTVGHDRQFTALEMNTNLAVGGTYRLRPSTGSCGELKPRESGKSGHAALGGLQLAGQEIFRRQQKRRPLQILLTSTRVHKELLEIPLLVSGNVEHLGGRHCQRLKNW
jgi:hypothetical protein